MAAPTGEKKTTIHIHKVDSYDTWNTNYTDGDIGPNDLVIIPPGQIQKKITPLGTQRLPIKKVGIIDEDYISYITDGDHDDWLITAAALVAYLNSSNNS